MSSGAGAAKPPRFGFESRADIPAALRKAPRDYGKERPMKNDSDSQNDSDGGMTGVMQRNIRTVLERRRAEDKNKSLQLRVADAITRFTGSMTFVYIHLILFAVWIVAN